MSIPDWPVHTPHRVLQGKASHFLVTSYISFSAENMTCSPMHVFFLESSMQSVMVSDDSSSMFCAVLYNFKPAFLSSHSALALDVARARLW